MCVSKVCIGSGCWWNWLLIGGGVCSNGVVCGVCGVLCCVVILSVLFVLGFDVFEVEDFGLVVV